MKLIFISLSIFCVLAQSVSGGELITNDYHVWSAFIGPGQVYIWHKTEPSAVYDRGVNLGEIDPAFYQLAVTASNQEPTKLQADLFDARKRINLLDGKSLRQIIGRQPQPTWLLSPRAIQGAAAVYRLSAPAYSEDGSTAYFLACGCSFWQGSLEFVTVARDSTGTWHLQRVARKDFTRWTAEAYLDE